MKSGRQHNKRERGLRKPSFFFKSKKMQAQREKERQIKKRQGV